VIYQKYSQSEYIIFSVDFVNFKYNDVEHFKTRKDLDAFNCHENISKKKKENSRALLGG